MASETDISQHLDQIGSVKRLAILTSGGDAQGMNAAIRAITRVAIYHRIEVYGVYEGFNGLIQGGEMVRRLTWDQVSGIIQKGGTILGTARCKEFRNKKGRRCAVQNLLLNNIQYLCVIGGDGSLTGASHLCDEYDEHCQTIYENQNLPDTASISSNMTFLNILGIVASIDNDMCDIDMTIGTDSALHRIIEAADSIKTTAGSHQRVFIIEVMGRSCGHLALISALTTEADYLFIPEVEVLPGWEDDMCQLLTNVRKTGQRFNIVFLAEGALDEHNKPLESFRVKKAIVDRLDYDTRITVLGHVQRGGKPSAYDRIFGSRLGAEAANFVAHNNFKVSPIILAVRGNRIIYLPLVETVKKTIAVSEAIENRIYNQVLQLRGPLFQRHLNLYLRLQSPQTQSKSIKSINLCIIHVGAPAGGQNPFTYVLCKLALSFGHIVYVAYDGFEGLAKGNFLKLDADQIIKWMSSGGSKLGTNRHLPDRDDFANIAINLQRFNIHALVIVGGFEGFLSLIRIESARQIFPPFRIPLILIPATISNNVPGTEYTLGSDTALNVIQECVDYLKQSASATRKRVFIVEVQGGYCGYLATMSALAGGADNAYTPEETFDIFSILSDVKQLVQRFTTGTKRGIILRNENADPYYTTDVLQKIYEGQSENTYRCRTNVLGHIQQGGAPSPLDRIYACEMATKCMDYVYEMVSNCIQNSGEVIAMDHNSVFVLGLIQQSFTPTPVVDLKILTNFDKRTHSKVWWKQIHILMRVLTDHFETEYAGEANVLI